MGGGWIRSRCVPCVMGMYSSLCVRACVNQSVPSLDADDDDGGGCGLSLGFCGGRGGREGIAGTGEEMEVEEEVRSTSELSVGLPGVLWAVTPRGCV